MIVLDSVGAGELPDAELFGDKGANTLLSCYKTGRLNIPNLIDLGLGNIYGLSFLGKSKAPKAAHMRLAEKSMGKDTTTGHWEIAGLVSNKPMPVYPDGFPKNITDEFERLTGRKVLCNKPYSGTDVIKDYGDEHIKTGGLIVYTSADSVFQIAAHEDIVSVNELYEYCRMARRILCGENAVGRVIARPFTGVSGSYKRTANRRDFSLKPHGITMLDAIKESGMQVISIGKISDIFAGCGITESNPTHGNTEGMKMISEILCKDFTGLCFLNLVDFDMLYGHRNDADGYANALNEFDLWLGGFIPEMHKDDMLIITADHGCDPGDKSTDHTREYIPALVYGDNIKPVNLGTRESYSDISKAVCEYLNVCFDGSGESFLMNII